MKKTTPSTKSSEDLQKALMDFQDLMERLYCPFIPLRSTAKAIKAESKLEDDIYVGVKQKEWTGQRESMFRTLCERMHYNLEDVESGYELNINDVPIHFQVIKRNYKFFENLNVRFYGVTEFMLPNPFDTYIKAQYLVK